MTDSPDLPWWMYRADGGPTYLDRHGHRPDEPCPPACHGNPAKPGGSGGHPAPPRREPCEDHDGGMRACCGTRQLGPHTENCPKSAAMAALRDELQALWSDLDTAIDATIRGRFTAPGAWSVHSNSIAARIIVLSRLADATPWEQVPYTRLLDGTYQGLLTAAGIAYAEPGEDDLRQMRECAAAAARLR